MSPWTEAVTGSFTPATHRRRAAAAGEWSAVETLARAEGPATAVLKVVPLDAERRRRNGWAMQKWQYLIVRAHVYNASHKVGVTSQGDAGVSISAEVDSMVEVLDQMGEAGWELVTAVESPSHGKWRPLNGDKMLVEWTFKKPKQS